YRYIVDYQNFRITNGLNIGGECVAVQGWSSPYLANRGDYTVFVGGGGHSYFYQTNPPEVGGYADFWDPPTVEGKYKGIWPESWYGIRASNMALEKMPFLIDATDEQKRLIEGQAYFFRAFFHWELIRVWGGMPYIDRVLQPNDALDYTRLSYQEITERIIEDFDKAAQLLPANWDDVLVKSPGRYTGYATKGAAMAFKAKALLFAGSPLMNGVSTGSYSINNEYMERAAVAAWEMLELANEGYYSLVPFDRYQENFAKNDGTHVWSEETIFLKFPHTIGSFWVVGGHGRIFTPEPSVFGGNEVCHAVVQNYIDKFEMADGTLYDISYDNDSTKRWNNRDPRLRKAILFDRDSAGYSPLTVMRLYDEEPGFPSMKGPNVLTPYICKKYLPRGVNQIDKLWDNYTYVCPHMRLAEVYLIYAEAANEAWGPNGKAPGADLTAIEAVNIVRNRAGHVDVLPEFTGTKELFRDRIRNERCVELAFEAQYWHDLRRWYIAHLPENKILYTMDFDRNHTNFNRRVVRKRIFEMRHYWMPLPADQIYFTEGFEQNPGWN
ncbi:MAG: RagB/SusD family nutrient uptake outer membrane protein, partial [bacterium]